MSHDDLMDIYLYADRDYGSDGDYVLYDGVYFEESGTSGTPIVSRIYTDGFGREIQSQKDLGSSIIISGKEYDPSGREWKNYKPFAVSLSSLSQSQHYFHNSIATAADSYYNSEAGDWAITNGVNSSPKLTTFPDEN